MSGEKNAVLAATRKLISRPEDKTEQMVEGKKINYAQIVTTSAAKTL